MKCEAAIREVSFIKVLGKPGMQISLKQMFAQHSDKIFSSISLLIVKWNTYEIVLELFKYIIYILLISSSLVW